MKKTLPLYGNKGAVISLAFAFVYSVSRAARCSSLTGTEIENIRKSIFWQLTTLVVGVVDKRVLHHKVARGSHLTRTECEGWPGQLGCHHCATKRKSSKKHFELYFS